MCSRRAQNLLILRSPQLSFTFGPYVRVGMDLYRQYAGFLPASKGSAMCYLSQNIGPVVAWSAGPALPPLRACFPSETFYDLFLLLFFFFVMLFRKGKREERWEGKPRGMMHGQFFCSHKTKNHKLKCFCEIVNPYITLLYLGGGVINPLLTSCGLLLPSVNQFTPTNSH